MTARDVVAAVPDPELPWVTIEELGILRAVDEREGRVVVTITPTYSGCPAMDLIRGEIVAALERAGRDDVEVRTELGPAWTTDWISEEGRRKLREAGIAPPGPRPPRERPLLQLGVSCPRCGSTATRRISRFGSTPCKAHHVCSTCGEPFDHFKAL